MKIDYRLPNHKQFKSLSVGVNTTGKIEAEYLLATGVGLVDRQKWEKEGASSMPIKNTDDKQTLMHKGDVVRVTLSRTTSPPRSRCYSRRAD